MDGSSDDAVDPEAPRIGGLPDGPSSGSTVLVASTGDPSRDALGLRILRRYGTATDTAFVVTTTESADRTIETYADLEAGTDRPSLGIVDTTSEQQSVSALYGETPVVFTPSPGDLERLVLALSELSGNTPLSNGGVISSSDRSHRSSKPHQPTVSVASSDGYPDFVRRSASVSSASIIRHTTKRRWPLLPPTSTGCSGSPAPPGTVRSSNTDRREPATVARCSAVTPTADVEIDLSPERIDRHDEGDPSGGARGRPGHDEWRRSAISRRVRYSGSE